MKFSYKNRIIDDLRNLESKRFAVAQMEAELETIKAEYAAIKATNYDKMPTGSGTNTQEEKLLTAIANKDELERNLAATRLHINDMERLLNALPDDERRVLERMEINREKYALDSLVQELGFEQAQIYRIRSKAIDEIAKMRYGIAYHP